MAKLCRFVKLQDRFDSQVFTFVLPNKLIGESTQDVYSKDFIYGYHRWTAIFVKNGLHLGTYLKLQTTSSGMKCSIDFSVTLLNRDHFTRNESFIEKGCVFTPESSQIGRKTFVEINDLRERDFMQDNGEFLVEIEMRNIVSMFECYLRLPKESHSRYSYGNRLESPYFCFGLFDWSVSLFSNEGNIEQDESVAVQLHRHSSFDHLCNVRYKIFVGEKSEFESEEQEQLIDLAGNGDPYTVGASLYKLARGRASLRVRVMMLSVVSISEITLNVNSRNKNRAHCYDKDKQAWLLEADTTGKYLTFKLYYTDVTHVPRKYNRYVSWNAVLLTRYKTDKPLKTNYGCYSNYYVQQDLDEGYQFRTEIPVDELQDPDSPFIDPEDQKLMVHIEWVASHLLICPNYSSVDDVHKLHKHQMWREILALQAENFALEKQVFSYQQSLSKVNKNDRKTNSSTEDGRASPRTRPQRQSIRQET